MAEVEFEPDQKEQENEPDLAEDGRDLPQERIAQFMRHAGDCRPEDRFPRRRREPLQKAWAKQESRYDLANHVRLTKPPSDAGTAAGRKQDDCQLYEQWNQQFFDRHMAERIQAGGVDHAWVTWGDGRDSR